VSVEPDRPSSLAQLDNTPILAVTRGAFMGAALRNGVSFEDAAELADLARTMDVRIGGKWLRVESGRKE
jgi:hypothetical protein